MDKLRIVTVEGTYTDHAHDKEPGFLQVRNQPPPGLEHPNFEQAKLDEDVFLIETDDPQPNSWTGCRVHWRGKQWIIELSQMISNGEQALIALNEENGKGLPIQGEEKAQNETP
jgi:hypothetical protein